jgi:hypothetical protein
MPKFDILNSRPDIDAVKACERTLNACELKPKKE